MITSQLEELFAPVLAWLDSYKPNVDDIGFNMGNYATQDDAQDYDGNDCGTACCIAGAVMILNNLKDPTADDSSVFDAIPYLGISKAEADELFFASRYLETQDGQFLNDLTPAHAAHTIRHFLISGIVDWSDFPQ